MRWIILTALFLSGLDSYAQEVSADTETAMDEKINLSIEKEPIESAMRMLAESAAVNVLLSPSIKGEVNAHIVDMDPRAALEQTILANGFYFVVQDNVYSVMSSEEYFEDRDQGRERRVFHLKHAHALELSETLKGSLSKKAVVVPYPSASALVVSEVSERWTEVEQLILDLDRPSRARVFPLSHAPAEQLVNILREYSADPRSIQADFRTNQIAISNTEPNMTVLESLIEQFDRPDKVSTRTIHLRYAPAEDVANLVREILTGQRTQNASNGVPSGSNNSKGNQIQSTPTAQISPPSSRRNTNTPFTTRSFPSDTAATANENSATAQNAAQDSPASTTQSFRGGSANESSMATSDAGEIGLGPLATVTADIRTNSIIITHTSAMLERLTAVIESIDIPTAP